ncbi:MAG TPA: XdhC family protein [Gemmatimonadaceae bacterium]
MNAGARAPHPALAAWSDLRRSGSARAALVTLARADGGSSRPVGTRLVVSDEGRTFGSVTIGGCADGRARTAAERILQSGGRELLTVPLGEEDAVALGLGCAGDVDLLIEAVATDVADAAARAFDAAARAMDDGRRAALLTPIDGRAGKLLVREDGVTAGTTGSDVRDAAATALGTALLGATEARSGVHEAAGERWLVELLTPTHTVLIVGATDIAAELCVMAARVGWRTLLIDPRDELLDESRFASAAERIAALPAETVADRVGGPRTAVVVVAHDYKVEIPVLRVALRSDAAYVGVLGSRKRAAAVRSLLADSGLTSEELARLRMPIGLAIGAQGAAEIAVSIVAELIASFRGRAPLVSTS